MIQRIKSNRIELPPIYLVENEKDWMELPKGLPYIMGKKEELDFITVFLEFQVLYKSCLKTNLPIHWLESLRKLGYNNCGYYNLYSGGEYYDSSTTEGSKITIDDFVKDSYFVDFDTLSDLKILPKWLDDIKAAVETNIIDEVTFDPLAFNKALRLNVGGMVVKNHKKNLLILDCSGSIPTSIVKSITILSKLLSKRFYADIIVTCGKSFFVDYEDVENTDIVELARIGGKDNESDMFRKIMKMEKDYNTCISFGDDDHPGYKIDSNFTIDTLYSLHTNKHSDNVTGYAKHFKPNTTHIVRDWVNTIQ